MNECVFVGGQLYERVQVAESILEGLLRTHAPAIFPGFRYFDFRPAIRSRYGTRHPDGALLSEHSERWWVVEVETHLHDVDTHVAPQLEALADGVYGPDALRYLNRFQDFDRARHSHLDAWEPDFLLIVDHVTPYLAGAASAYSFDLLECAVYRSREAAYGLRLSGRRPDVGSGRLGRGIDLTLVDEGGVAVLVAADCRFTAGEPHLVVVEGSEVTAYVTADGTALALPLRYGEVSRAGIRYRLVEGGSLLPLEDTS